jgi:lipoate-protein ligase A
VPPINHNFPALKFDQPWQLIRPEPIRDPEASIRYDEILLQRVGRGEIGPCICIKVEPHCLIVTRREARMTNFAQACTTLASQGWPVVVRCSGGSCVPQGPGMLNLSLIHPRLKSWTLEDGYLLLCELFSRLLTSYGIEAESGEVTGSFCDGRYNLQSGGKKLVGTAQRWTGGNREQAAVLAHACLLVDLDLPEATDKINQLYRLCSNPQRFDPAACTTLRNLQQPRSQLERETFVASVEQRLAALICESFNISPSEV